MKKVLVLFILLLVCGCVSYSAKAEMEVRDYMSYEWMRTQGYSTDMLKLVEINKAKTFGEKIPQHWSQNKFRRGWQKFWAYIDPATDYGDFGEHDIKMQSTIWDY